MKCLRCKKNRASLRVSCPDCDNLSEVIELESQLQLIEKMKNVDYLDFAEWDDGQEFDFLNQSSLYIVLESYLKESGK